MVLLAVPDYAVSHALNALLIKYIKHRETQYHFNFGRNSLKLPHNCLNSESIYMLQISDHKYSSAEPVPDTFSYTGHSDVLDLTKYFIYQTCLVVIVFVSSKRH